MAVLIEDAEAHNAIQIAIGRQRWRRNFQADWLWTPAGCAVFGGYWTHITQALAVGLEQGIVRRDLTRMTQFFRMRGAIPTLHVCGFLEEQIAFLRASGFEGVGAAAVLARELNGPAPVPLGTGVEETDASNTGDWVHVAAQAFTGKRRLTHEDCEPGGVVAGMSGVRRYWARARSRPAATAALAIYGRTAILFCDATSPAARGRGLQSELIRARVHAARLAGCTLATATAQPDSTSYRNYLRNGFAEVYQRIALQLHER